MTDQITVSRELLRQFLDESVVTSSMRKAYTELRAALEQPAAQKPDRTGMRYYKNDRCTASSADAPDCICWTPITPPQAQQPEVSQ